MEPASLVIGSDPKALCCDSQRSLDTGDRKPSFVNLGRGCVLRYSFRPQWSNGSSPDLLIGGVLMDVGLPNSATPLNRNRLLSKHLVIFKNFTSRCVSQCKMDDQHALA